MRIKASTAAPFLAALLFFLSASSWAACTGSSPTWTSTPDQSSVSTCLSNASAGDTINVSAGSATWTAIAINKAVTLNGAGTGSTTITLAGNSSIAKQAAGVTRIKNFTFVRNTEGNNSYAFYITGAWTARPVIFQNNAVTMSNAGFFRVEVSGGFIVANNSFTADWDDSILKLKNAGGLSEWNTASTMGTLDTNGEKNIYIEDNTFYGGTNQGIDCDDACRVVYRHNTLTYSSFNSHGYDTSDVGARHWEIYNNTFIHDGGTSAIANQNWIFWIRGGTGVIHNNVFPDIAGGWWGDKAEFKFSIRGIQDSYTKVFGSCGAVSYPAPRQLGQGHNGSSQVLDPIYIWGNTGPLVGIAGGLDSDWGNPCSVSWNNFYQINRDYYSGSAKPSYTTYTYPHPLVSGAPADNENPTAPSNLSATAASASQINLSWTAGTDNVGIAGYDIQRCSGAACTPTGTVYQTSGTGTTYSSTGLAASTLYRYWVRSRDAAGNVSAYTSIAEATTQASAPTNLRWIPL